MHYLLACAAAIWLAPSALADPQPNPTLVERQATTTTSCAAGAHLMVAGGCALPCQTGDDYGLLKPLIGNITAAIPGSDVYLVPYTNATTPGVVATPVMINATQQYAAMCPNTPIIFIGYSVGGIIIMNTLCGGIGPNYTQNIIFTSVYGEETYVGNQLYDKSSCTANAPKTPRNNTFLCNAYAPIIQNYCFNTDPNCCNGGTLPLAHFAYPGYYDQEVLANATIAYSSYTSARSLRTSSHSTTTSPTIKVVTTTKTIVRPRTTRVTTITSTKTVKPKTTAA